MRARRQALRERERACVRERGGRGGGGTAVRGGGAWLCAAEVHGWHALESCGLLSLVRLVSRRVIRLPYVVVVRLESRRKGM
jgi:hypothetical protein